MNAGRGSPQWRHAVCAVETPDAPEMWTPDRRPRRVVLQHLEAMCQRCPLLVDCALWALDTAAQSGLYAGVWVPQQSEQAAWAAAQHQLAAVATGGDPALGVSA